MRCHKNAFFSVIKQKAKKLRRFTNFYISSEPFNERLYFSGKSLITSVKDIIVIIKIQLNEIKIMRSGEEKEHQDVFVHVSYKKLSHEMIFRFLGEFQASKCYYHFLWLIKASLRQSFIARIQETFMCKQNIEYMCGKKLGKDDFSE